MKKLCLATAISLVLTACGTEEAKTSTDTGSTSGGSKPTTPTTPPTTPPSSGNVIDLHNAADVKKLGNNYTIQLLIERLSQTSAQKSERNRLSINAVVFAKPILPNLSQSFAQYHGAPIMNFKTQGAAKIHLTAKAMVNGKEYDLKNFDLVHQQTNAWHNPDLSIFKVENDINTVSSWQTSPTFVFNSALLNQHDKIDMENGLPMNVYVKVNNTLSNGIQLYGEQPEGAPAYQSIRVNNSCTKPAYLADFGSYTCANVHGYSIPVLVEDNSTPELKANEIRVQKTVEFLIQHFPKVIAQNIYENDAAMVFFKELDGWDERPAGEFANENLRFQDLGHDETNPADKTRRDASFEEIIHFVHDYGIMSEAVKSPGSTWHKMQAELDRLTLQSILVGHYFPNGKDPLTNDPSLDAESYDQEYLAYSMYAYYDLNPAGYVSPEFGAATYQELKQKEPEMVTFFETYFPTRAAFAAFQASL